MHVEIQKAHALSLFAGIGGFEVGMSRCGFTFEKTLEWDMHCCETLMANKQLTGSSENEISPIDITNTPPEKFYNQAIDYIVGGPPCQSFSAAGRRAGGVSGTNDLRGTLFWHYCRYVEHYKPKAFVFENVRGILSSNKGEDFKIICSSFEEVGYKLFWRILNAADYGVPQQRERLFLVGIRTDLNIDFKFPRPTHGPDSPHKNNYITVGEALRGLGDESEIVPPYGGKYGHLIPDIPNGENYRYYTEEMGHPNPLFAWRSKFSNFLYKLNPEDVCRTIIAYQGKYDGPFHWKNRKCTVDELKRLQGFPDDFVLPQSYVESVKQVGNSVCPPVAFQIGKALRYQIEGNKDIQVPLLDNGHKLTFDQRKGVKAKQSKKKITSRYSQIRQIGLFDESAQIIEHPKIDRRRTFDRYDIFLKYENGDMNIIVINQKKSSVETEIVLNFFGNVTQVITRITAKSFSSLEDEHMIELLWSEIHAAIQEFTSYDSLLPLYGHFTEPYPKFDISFHTGLKTQSAKFQEFAINKNTSNKILKYDEIGANYEIVEAFLKEMRAYGFDVRNNNTNRTIPEHNFRICYPFTMPKDLKRCVTWNDRDSDII